MNLFQLSEQESFAAGIDVPVFRLAEAGELYHPLHLPRERPVGSRFPEIRPAASPGDEAVAQPILPMPGGKRGLPGLLHHLYARHHA